MERHVNLSGASGVDTAGYGSAACADVGNGPIKASRVGRIGVVSLETFRNGPWIADATERGSIFLRTPNHAGRWVRSFLRAGTEGEGIGLRTEDETDEDFASWVASCQHRLLRATYLMTGNLQHAEDLLQDAFIKVARRWDGIAGGNPDAYIRTILYRDHISWWRRQREYPSSVIHAGAEAYVGDASEQRLMVRDALARLTSKQRAVLVLRYFDDLTERETADILGVTRGTVKSQTSVALQRLRTAAPELSDLWSESGDER